MGPGGKRASTREAGLSDPLTNYGLHLVTYSIVGQPLLERRSGQTQTFPLSLAFFFSVLFLVRPRKRTKKNGAVRHGGRWGKRASTRQARLSDPLTNYGLHLVTYSIVGQPLLERRSGQTQTFPLSLAFVFSPSFFLYAQEKGPKRTAPFGTGPVFPSITSGTRINIGRPARPPDLPIQRCWTDKTRKNPPRRHRSHDGRTGEPANPQLRRRPREWKDPRSGATYPLSPFPRQNGFSV